MCTAFVSIEPAAAVPVLLLSVRDEYLGRAWLPPGRHWPDRPGLLGGLDLAAGGTWLAVDPARRTAACLLNGFGPAAPADTRRTRGRLPLTAVTEGGTGHLDLTPYDPFHLLLARPDGVAVTSWDGVRAERRELPAGLSVVLNDGLEGRAANRADSERISALMASRADHFRARFAAAPRPEPTGDGPAERAWGAWLPIVTGDGLALDEDAALVQRRDFGNGRIWGSSSISLLALGPDGLRYDFAAAPVGADGVGWRRVAD
ncbi:NRDE family protein [Streptomyces sp. 1331.2]|uniref:NRDE family protein n=1 Tax=Streptomyces sp. 1331.2 TaxID=1938835 RepID=UPI000BDD77E3|nr:NRDE family protein [Streptomyces sp. 1331.2]SOB82702.1 Transport and Golgi organisation 2 [Streptomyces sp. 1331.2]